MQEMVRMNARKGQDKCRIGKEVNKDKEKEEKRKCMYVVKKKTQTNRR